MASSDGKPGGVFEHHVQTAVCDSRAKYREGRRPRAVKVYTINLESQYLLIQGVPAVGAMKELVERFALYGAIEQYNALDEYPAEDFTEVYLIKFVKLQSARVAKKRMDEQSFFGGLLHVCYAPEFETVEETRKKLEERKAYIARVTKNQDYYMKKKPVPEQQGTKDSGQDFHPSVPGFGTAALDTCPEGALENASPCLPYSCEFPLSYFASKSTCSPGEHTDRAPHSCNSARNHGDLPKHRHHSAFPPKPQMDTYKSPAPCSGVQEAIAASQAVGRFMPRTTQLQERKRRRDCDRELGTNTSSNEVLIGPKLPGIPTVDLQDDSLNTTANLIRNKLKEVISSVPMPPADNIKDVCTSHPQKQRRRI